MKKTVVNFLLALAVGLVATGCTDTPLTNNENALVGTGSSSGTSAVSAGLVHEVAIDAKIPDKEFADGISEVLVRAYAKNSSGENIAGKAIRFQSVNGAYVQFVDGTTDKTVVTNSEGGYADVYVKAPVTLQVADILVTSGGKRAVHTIEFVAGAASLAQTSIDVFYPRIKPGESTPVRMYVRDSNGNPIEGEQVTFQITTTLGGTINELATTNRDGVAIATYKASVNTGTETIHARLVNNSSISKVANVEIDVNEIAVDSLSLLTNSLVLKSGDVEGVIVTALVKGEGNVLKDGVEVNFLTDARIDTPTCKGGGALSHGTVKTANNGVAQTVLLTPGDACHRVITVTAKAGDKTETIDISVIGNKINFSGEKSIVSGGYTDLSLRLTDSKDNGIPSAKMTFLSKQIVTLLYGEAYQDAGTVLAIHVWAAISVFLGVASGKWFLAENRQLLSLQRTVLGAVVNVALNFWFIPIYGAVGAALATVLSYTITVFFADLMHKETKKMFSMKVSALNPLALYKRYI